MKKWYLKKYKILNKPLFFSFLFLILGGQLFSQKHELGSVTKEELLQKHHPTDTSAVAAILFKKAKTKFRYSEKNGFDCQTEFTIKIKIYKKTGLKWANFEIPYYIGYKELEDEMVNISKAFTYNLENGKIEKTKVLSEGKNIEKVNEFWKTKLIAFPNVKEGSIIEIKYTLKSQNLSVLPDFQFQYEIPVNYMEFITEIPEFYIYKVMVSGKLDINNDEKIEFTSASFDEKVDLAKVSNTFTFRQIINKYSLNDIKPLISEEYVTNIENYYGKIEHELQTIRMPNEVPKQLATDWVSVTKSIYNEPSFGLELNKNGYFSTIINNLVDINETDQIKATKIFNFVKNRMNWDGKYGYLTKKGVENAYNEKVGNAAEINLILTSMLRYAGLEAKPILISTRDHGIAQFANRTKINYLITSVIINKKIFMLDATNKNATFNILPIRDLNWYGRMIEGNGNSTEVFLMPEFFSNKMVYVMAAITSDGIVEGKIKEQYFDYESFNFRENYGKLATESYLEYLEKKHNNSEISDYSITGVNEIENPIVESYSFKNSNSAEIIGDKLYFSPMLFFAINENPFKQDDREYPIDFIFPKMKEYKFTIDLPKGYKVESLPKESKINMKDNYVNLNYNIINTDNKIQLSINYSINTAIINAENYKELKTVFNEIVKKQNEKIVLKKI